MPAIHRSGRDGTNRIRRTNAATTTPTTTPPICTHGGTVFSRNRTTVCDPAGERRPDDNRVRGRGVRLLKRRRRVQNAGDGGELCADHDLRRDRFTYPGRTRNMHRAIELAADRTVHAGLDTN